MKHVLAAMIFIGIIAIAGCTDHIPPTNIGENASPNDRHRRIALLAILADINYDLIVASEDELLKNTQKISDALQNNSDVKSFIGNDWQVVWGPAISNSIKKSTTSAVDSFVTDNTMYVARGTDLATGKPMYVVAIAGTNAVSRKGAISEDINIVKEKSWGAPNSGKISAGSEVGFNILNMMTDVTSGKTLIEYLSTLKDNEISDIAFTGHSLGGALSPLIALKFIEWKEQMNYTNITVSVYPIAGPTPGNKEFAAYAAEKFGTNYHSVINANDIVPHAWQKDMFAKIPTLYKNSPPFNSGGKDGFKLPSKDQLAYDALKLEIDFKTYQRIAPDQEYVFTGSANVYPDGAGTFFKEAKYQHTIAYYKEAFQFPQRIIDTLSK